MNVLLLTGPPAAGKNTIAEQLAKRRGRCAVIDVDTLRMMVVDPRPEPWEGEDGPRQQQLGLINACTLTKNFVADGFNVIVIDAMTDAMLDEYRFRLQGLHPWVVQLLPSEDEVSARLLSRPDYLSRGEISWLYDQQVALENYDERIDNGQLSPEHVAEWLLERWTRNVVA